MAIKKTYRALLIASLSCLLYFNSYASSSITQSTPDQLAGFIANNNPPGPLLTLNLNNNPDAATVFTLKNPQLGIPSLYTADSFKKLYPAGFNAAIKASHNEQLPQLYVAQYASSWAAFLNNFEIKSNTDPIAAYKQIKLLASNKSPITQLLVLFQSNAIPPVINMDHNLAALNQLTTNTALPYSAAQVQKQLDQLASFLKPLDGRDPSYAAYQLAAYRLNNQGKNDPISNLFNLAQIAPPPIKTWLYEVAQNTWEMLLFNAQVYIDRQWQQKVATQYNAQISGLYPFNPVSGNQVSLNSFINFFSPNGIFDQFISNTLRPFVDTSQQPWQIKSLDGRGLDISAATLESLQQTQNIQELFFPNGDQHLRVSFVIEASTIPSDLKEIIFMLGNQQGTWLSGGRNAVQFIWPDSKNSNVVSINFVNKNNQTTTLDASGPWALLRLLQEGNMDNATQNNAWSLSFTSNGQTVKMILTPQAANPFVLNLFSGFQFPQSL